MSFKNNIWDISKSNADMIVTSVLPGLSVKPHDADRAEINLRSSLTLDIVAE